MTDANEAAVKACYATWGKSYYDEYYGDKAPYPPVFRDILAGLLRRDGVRTVLDAGCGSASFLRGLFGQGLELYGFDLTPEMVAEAREVFRKAGLPPRRIWEGNVLDGAAYRPPDGAEAYDALVLSGVLPHIPEDAEERLLGNLRAAVRPGGLVLAEARNELFALFTLNRYTWEFFSGALLGADRLAARATEAERADLDRCLAELRAHFRTDLPPVRTGKADEPGYDQILSRTHNPLVLQERFLRAGFAAPRVYFYHYHCLPPMFEARFPELFRRASLALENPTDWRGYFMASAFILAAEAV